MRLLSRRKRRRRYENDLGLKRIKFHHSKLVTFARASLAASASAAIALWSCTGKRTSLL
jgi:hypothetical protein